jgi:hypothetical protein
VADAVAALAARDAGAVVIARLRRRHRVATIALAALMPPALAVALIERAEAPTSAVPVALIGDVTIGSPRWSRDDLFAALSIRARGFAGERGAVVELQPLLDPLLPDLLVYWSADGAGDALPEGAQLLGRLAGVEARRFALPAPSGRLHLYSLGHARLVDSAALPDAG